MKNIYLTVLAIAALVLVAAPSTAQAANLLSNPSFESTDAPWVRVADGGNMGVERAGGVGRSGAGLAAMTIWGVNDWGHTGTGSAYQTVAATSNTNYAYSIWVTRESGDLTGSYYMKLAWYNGANFVWEDTSTYTPTLSYAQQTLNVTSPLATVDSVRVILGQTFGSQRGIWDDADLELTGYPPPVPEPTSMLLLGTGLVGLLGFASKTRKKRS